MLFWASKPESRKAKADVERPQSETNKKTEKADGNLQIMGENEIDFSIHDPFLKIYQKSQ